MSGPNSVHARINSLDALLVALSVTAELPLLANDFTVGGCELQSDQSNNIHLINSKVILNIINYLDFTKNLLFCPDDDCDPLKCNGFCVTLK